MQTCNLLTIEYIHYARGVAYHVTGLGNFRCTSIIDTVSDTFWKLLKENRVLPELCYAVSDMMD